ncbi:MAG: type II toxin-antitoxin system VapC family toxin [Euryarchaeota archaeon]|nr:type II toxin-antitoxin system VapC family toxin [Euryarchaeota archaeon]
MKFLDANIFIYAYYKPKKRLNKEEQAMKNFAKEIIDSINQGKAEIITSVVHISEMVNILKHGTSIKELDEVISSLFMLDNVKIFGVSKEEYFMATELGSELKLDPNDALAVQIMKKNKATQIYSFDSDFNKVEEITRLPKIEKS